MRAALSIVLAGLLVTTPIKQVLAQADQQQSQTAAQEAPVGATPDTTSSEGRVGIPALERGSAAALLWAAHATAPATDSLAYDVPPRRVSTAGWIVIAVIGVAVVLFGIAVIVFCTSEDLGC